MCPLKPVISVTVILLKLCYRYLSSQKISLSLLRTTPSKFIPTVTKDGRLPDVMIRHSTQVVFMEE